MNVSLLLEIAFGFWFLQQVNDIVNAFLNRKFVPKMFWLSAGSSLVGGLFQFLILYILVHDVGQIAEFLS